MSWAEAVAAVLVPVVLAAIGALVRLERRLTRIETDMRWVVRAMRDRGFTPRENSED